VDKEIMSGCYCGPEPALKGKRGILLSNVKKSIYSDHGPDETVLVQWDDWDLWLETVRATGQGWEPYLFCEFDDFHYNPVDDDSLLGAGHNAG